MLRILDSGINSANDIMRFDEKLLDQIKEPTLHLYNWASPSLTHGYFIRPENHLSLKNLEIRGINLARRPTGGGIVFHIWDLAFSFLLPSDHPAFSLTTLTNYRFVNKAVLETVEEFFGLGRSAELILENGPDLGPDCGNFCMAKPTQYDVVHNGMKVAGAAQRKRKEGYLHQGTISLVCPDIDLLSDVLLSKEDVLKAMQSFAFAPLGKDLSRLQKTRVDLQKLLASKLEIALISPP